MALKLKDSTKQTNLQELQVLGAAVVPKLTLNTLLDSKVSIRGKHAIEPVELEDKLDRTQWATIKMATMMAKANTKVIVEASVIRIQWETIKIITMTVDYKYKVKFVWKNVFTASTAQEWWTKQWWS